ncbi:MAG: S8 family serine peptidase [Chloroflexota bacterium]
MHHLDIVLQTNEPLTGEQTAVLRQKGFRLVAAVGPQAYRLRGESDETLASLNNLDFVAQADEVAPLSKLDAGLQAEVRQAEAASSSSGQESSTVMQKVIVSLDRFEDTDATLTAIAQLGAIESSSKRRALVNIASGRLEALAAISGVMAAEIEPENHTQNNVARNLIKLVPAANTFGLDGSNEIVGVADSGLDTGVNNGSMLADFAGRVINIRATVDKSGMGVADGADLNNHGTHVSGSILGDGSNSNGNITGMAPAAQITVLAMGPDNTTSLTVPADLTTDVFQDAYDDGARLHNNSWGARNSAGGYNSRSDDVDLFVRDNPDMLILIAAGNEGVGTSTVTAPGTAKNCLTVGAAESVRPLPTTVTLMNNPQDDDFNPATPDQNVPLMFSNFDRQADNFEHIASFSGRGPTVDGRIKPDIVAPGSWILSTRSQISTADLGPDGRPPNDFYADDADGVATHDEAVGRGLPGAPIFGAWDQDTPAAPAGSGPNAQQNYFYNSGTSMATPVATGAATLLRQYLRERRGVANPSAALMKALLVNGATVPTGESNAPNNDRGFGWLNVKNTLTPQPTGQQAFSDDVDLAVAENEVRQFFVQLADTGHPFRATLVWNDEPADTLQNWLYLRVIDPNGNVINGDVTPISSVSNNVQRVHIDAPIAGTYTIEVHGVRVLFGIDAHPAETRQDFALAVINGIGFSPNPISVAQIIDRSGSMGTYGFIEPVKERAKQFVDLLRINDRVGVVSFNGTAATEHPVVAIDGLAAKTAVKNNIDTLTANGVTSIGAGLAQGIADLAAGGDPNQAQALILLSDGHENQPPWVGGNTTDSPPSWYSGPDFSEVLPTLPPNIPVYTVSLGIQSDTVLLQEIANETGGVFHAIHSPADIGELHEIYMHLQALTGGEEVITAGSSRVNAVPQSDGAQGQSNGNGAASPELVNQQLVAALETTRVDLRPFFTSRTHTIPVDESLHSLTALVSWHNPAQPVSLMLISPSSQVIQAGNVQHVNQQGSSYQYFRIENPEPGPWQMVVRADSKGHDRVQQIPYSWGAWGNTPLRLRHKLAPQPAAPANPRLVVGLGDSDKVARSRRFTATSRGPRLPLAGLLDRFKRPLSQINLPFEPDNPRVNPNLYKLALLDQQRRAAGRRTIFSNRTRRLRLTRPSNFQDAIPTNVPGLYRVAVQVRGKSQEGFAYQRSTRFNLHV